jgi:hypothetical protein
MEVDGLDFFGRRFAEKHDDSRYNTPFIADNSLICEREEFIEIKIWNKRTYAHKGGNRWFPFFLAGWF